MNPSIVPESNEQTREVIYVVNEHPPCRYMSLVFTWSFSELCPGLISIPQPSHCFIVSSFQINQIVKKPTIYRDAVERPKIVLSPTEVAISITIPTIQIISPIRALSTNQFDSTTLKQTEPTYVNACSRG